MNTLKRRWLRGVIAGTVVIAGGIGGVTVTHMTASAHQAAAPSRVTSLPAQPACTPDQYGAVTLTLTSMNTTPAVNLAFVVSNLQYGIENSASIGSAGGGAGAGKAKFEDVTFSKPSDKLDPSLMTAIGSGTAFKGEIKIAPKPLSKTPKTFVCRDIVMNPLFLTKMQHQSLTAGPEEFLTAAVGCMLVSDGGASGGWDQLAGQPAFAPNCQRPG